MSHLSKIFNKVPVKVQKRSGFDLSHENLFTAKVGQLIPASVEEVMPGDVVSIGSAFSVELPPLATDFKGRVDAKMEAFFVPNRVIWAGWKNFITNDIGGTVNSGQSGYQPGEVTPAPRYVPKISLNASQSSAGSLADYLGVKNTTGNSATAQYYNALPFAAYWKVWDDWYRDSVIQKPFFLEGIRMTQGSSASADAYAAGLPYLFNAGTISTSNTSNIAAPGNRLGYNGKSLSQLATRNFAKDYLTTMTPEPQAGAAAELEFSVGEDAEGAQTGKFSIASLRAANSLQKWLERNNLAGTRYYDQILAHYGVLPPDANVDRAILLGATTSPVIVNSISQTMQGTNSQTANPYGNTTGAQFGKGRSFGEGRLVDNFEVKEHGYIIILFSLVPHAYYGTGTRRYLSQRSTTDTFAFPEFANIGDQPVKRHELCSEVAIGSTDDITVGYNQRFSEYKYHEDEVHGKLRDGEQLSAFVLQRGFDSGVTLGSSLLEIPSNYLDSVMVTTEAVTGFNAVVDAYFDAKYLRVLPEYSLPSLCAGPGEGYEDGKTVMVDKGGRRL